MRLYSYTNYYLSPIQKGIQTQHVVSEITLDYLDKVESLPFEEKTKTKEYYFLEWLKNYKTTIVLNGGCQSDLENIFKTYEMINHKLFSHELPMAKFYEEKRTLNGALTAIGVVLPESIYQHGVAILKTNLGEYNSMVEESPTIKYDKFQHLLPIDRVSFLMGLKAPKEVIAASLIFDYKLA